MFFSWVNCGPTIRTRYKEFLSSINYTYHRISLTYNKNLTIKFQLNYIMPSSEKK